MDQKDKKPEEKVEKESEQPKKENNEEKKEAEKTMKTEAVVNSFGAPLSTKYSIAICRFIKGKKIENAIFDLEQVIVKKKAIPMKGEIPHRKGKIMAGRYPERSSKYFIKILKSLLANTVTNGFENPTITEAIANIASRPYGRFGRVRKKRTNIKIVAREKKILTKKKNKEKVK